MAILRSVDGRFFDIPDEELDPFEVPPEMVRQLMGEMGGGPGTGGPGGPGEPRGPGQPGAGQRRPQGGGEVEAYGRHWYWWRNCWRNHWRNSY